MYSIILLTVLAQPAAEPAAAGGIPPQHALASIDARGNLTITQVSSSCYGGWAVPVGYGAPQGDKAPAKPKVKVTHLMVTMTEMSAKDVRAFTAAGQEISAEKLATLLAKERTVLVALDGKKVDPFHLRLYKDDTIVLVPPANTMGGGGWGGWGYGAASVYQPAPVPVTPAPPAREVIKTPRRKDDGR